MIFILDVIHDPIGQHPTADLHLHNGNHVSLGGKLLLTSPVHVAFLGVHLTANVQQQHQNASGDCKCVIATYLIFFLLVQIGNRIVAIIQENWVSHHSPSILSHV